MSDLTPEPLGAGRVETRELDQEVRTSFLDYAMSVIVSRALPDVRDGLKPVHRRVLYAMHEAGLQPNRPTRKSARVVGDVMGNYHPHGDLRDLRTALAAGWRSPSDALPANRRAGLLRFWSDGDPPGAMRYTECRLSQDRDGASCADIDGRTPSTSNRTTTSHDGGAVGAAGTPSRICSSTGRPALPWAWRRTFRPHNLGEVVDAINAMIERPRDRRRALSKQVKGPGFPDGAARSSDAAGIRGTVPPHRPLGRITVRGRAHIEQLRGGKSAIIITELPYGVRKAGEGGVIDKIADLVKAGTLTEVPMSDDALQDHSDKEGMRIYVELKREAVPQVALNKLFKLTPLQTTFGYNAVALVDGAPETLSLLELIRPLPRLPARGRHAPVEVRASPGREARARPRGLPQGARPARRGDRADSRRRRHRCGARGAHEHLRPLRDPGAGDPRPPPLPVDEARAGRDPDGVRRPAGAHRELRAILGDPARIDGRDQGRADRAQGDLRKSDDRRTEIVQAEDELELEDLIAEEDMVIAITRSNYIKRLPVTTYREQRRGGIGVMGMDLKDEDYIEHLFVASTHDYILFFTNVGKVYRLKVHELPLGSRQSKGRAIQNLLPFRQDEQVRAVIQTRELRGGGVPRLCDEERCRQEDEARRRTTRRSARRDHRDQDA
jgi:DNA gyrase subunit A